MRGAWLRFWLPLVAAFDRLRLRLRVAGHPGLEIDPTASSNLAGARLQLAPTGRLRIGPGVVTERRAGWLNIIVGEGAEVEIGPRAWLRTEIGAVDIVAHAGGRIELGADSFLNGCALSAKHQVTVGERAWVGPGSRLYDSDQHDFDAERPERGAPIRIGDHAWIASDVTVLKGVSVGEHSIIGAGSLVNRDVPAHTLAFGRPATPRGEVGDRSNTR